LDVLPSESPILPLVNRIGDLDVPDRELLAGKPHAECTTTKKISAIFFGYVSEPYP
jgi:hypothetical protein